jgi:hypothetical protein
MQPETFFDLARATRAESVTACREFPPEAFNDELVPGFMSFRIGQAGPAFWEREVTHFSGARVTMMEMLLLIRQHEAEHRAQAAVLSRMRGIVPATTRKRQAAAAK